MHAAFSALSALVIAALWVDGRIVLHREVRALIAAANDLEQRQYPRPIHVDAAPLPGTFGERFVHAVPILVAEVKRGRDEVDRFLCTSVRDGSAPVTALTDECRDSIARAAEATRIAREATRAERADPPPGLSVLSDPKDPMFGDEGWLTVQHAGKISALEIRLCTFEGRIDVAVSQCLDTLALGRDATYGGGLFGAPRQETPGRTPC